MERLRNSSGNILTEKKPIINDNNSKDKFNNRKGRAEGIILASSAISFAIGVMFIVIFASSIRVTCNLEDNINFECKIITESIWIPNFYCFNHIEEFKASDIEKVYLYPIGYKKLSDDHDTAEAFDNLQCHTKLHLSTRMDDISLTLSTIPCFDTSVLDSMNDFLYDIHEWKQIRHNESPSFYFSQSTSSLPQFIGLGFVIFSFILGYIYYLNLPYVIYVKLYSKFETNSSSSAIV